MELAKVRGVALDPIILEADPFLKSISKLVVHLNLSAHIGRKLN